MDYSNLSCITINQFTDKKFTRPIAKIPKSCHITRSVYSISSPQLGSHEVDHLEVGRNVAGGREAVVALGELWRDGVGGHGTNDLAAGEEEEGIQIQREFDWLANSDSRKWNILRWRFGQIQ